MLPNWLRCLRWAMKAPKIGGVFVIPYEDPREEWFPSLVWRESAFWRTVSKNGWLTKIG